MNISAQGRIVTSFWCDNCVRAIGFKDKEIPDWVIKDGWHIDLEKYIVLCPDCSDWDKRRWPKMK